MTHYDITIGNDVARDVYYEIIMGHSIVVGTYHDVTMHTDVAIKCGTTCLYRTICCFLYFLKTY